MLTLFDYLPSQNGWKIRQVLAHLGLPYRTQLVSIFEGAGQHPEYLAINPTGAVPAIRLDDGRVLAESNAILWYLAEGTPLLPDDRFGVLQAARPVDATRLFGALLVVAGVVLVLQPWKAR